MKDETLRSALQDWEKISATQEQYLAYEARAKRIIDEEAAQREAELRVQEAEEKVAEAEQKATKAVQKTEERIARELLSKGSDIEFVAGATGIDKERVIEIKREMQLP
ncbi:FKBP-type peptidyl-prolyl cis-trans isomerase [Virgibacillus natechei]|uniref:FKBP-type peptidyl-prolyl cis-trans isomerase n=1 Tax=Virgibacillus natechei TaxID=1216297 RepID=A0ABS4IFF7_9BACI|nr:hypothetical protein [Virgibacillus natechei]MBP1969206.1 FKBP-type peptidyl-prolyl cis-trans isomerase [Virgibacillus natechei]UZD12370.1 hypothetical protein OLD84_15870 [Virgibacillus natechei]